MASCGELEDDYSLRLGVEAISEMCVELGIAIPVGKDSLSMKTRWEEGNKNYEVKSPLSGVISGIAPVPDVTKAITTELNTLGSKNLYHLTISDDRRLGGSILEEVTNSLFAETPDINNIQTLKDLFNFVQDLIIKGWITALHDISDGGLFTTLAELAFTNKIGFDVFLKEHTNNVENIFAELFSEECGLVIQVLAEREDEILEYIKANNIQFTHCGTQNSSLSISVIQDGKQFLKIQ